MRFFLLISSLLLAFVMCGVQADTLPLVADEISSGGVTTSNAEDEAYDYETALKTSQSAIDNSLANYMFTNAKGERN